VLREVGNEDSDEDETIVDKEAGVLVWLLGSWGRWTYSDKMKLKLTP
jgi:hypothetical protein